MDSLLNYVLTGASVAGFLIVIAGPPAALAYRHLHACIHRIEHRMNMHLPLIYQELRENRERLVRQETLERERNQGG